MATFPLDPEDPRTVGRYTLRARLGEGGMGVVYLAESAEGTVAIKVVRRALASDHGFRARFRREVEAARRVQGRGVVQLLDADTDGPRPYLVMGYVDGPTLGEAVAADGPLQGDRLQALSVALAEAVATIHRVGVTHRDLKPTNVLLTEDQPVVVDFGVATATEATSITLAGTVMGSPGWMAPEQVIGASPSPAMDVFAWGTLVAWAATGRNPFGTGRPDAVAYRIIHDEPDLSGLAGELRRTVAAAMSKDPARRPTAEALLAQLLDQTPEASPAVLAADATALLARTWVLTPILPPPSPPLPPSPWPVDPPSPRRRRRGRSVAVVLAVVVLSAAAGLGAGLLIRELRDRDEGDGGLAGGANPAPDPTTTTSTTTTTTTVPTVDRIRVRWVIADDVSRTVGDACEADPPYDGSAGLGVEDGRGTTLAEPVAVEEGVAEPGTGVLDDLFGATSCVYTVAFDGLPVVNRYRFVPSTDDPPTEVPAAELRAASWQVEIVVDVGGSLIDVFD
jgi:eukaryotic-like serine/threonine-protein kinase